MRSSSQPRGRTGGNSVVRWYSKSSRVGQPSSWPRRIQAAKVSTSEPERPATGTNRSGVNPDHHHPGLEGVAQPLLVRGFARIPPSGPRGPGRGRARCGWGPSPTRPAGGPSGGRSRRRRAPGSGRRWRRGPGRRRGPGATGRPGWRRIRFDVDLDGRRGAHHGPAGEALDVEVGLHGRVAGPVEDALRGPERIETPGHRSSPPRRSSADRAAMSAAAAASARSGRGAAGC